MSIYKNGKLIAGLSISYHPDLFDWKWADHKLNDVQWLRADSFSWHNESVYQAAYQHLVDDISGKTLQSETISGTTIQFYLSDDGHKICPASEESNVTAIYNATGVAWYYIIDTTNQRFKLPRAKHNKYTESLSVVGTGKVLGLTNGSVTYGLNSGSTYARLTMGNNAGQNVANSGGYDAGYNVNWKLGVATDPTYSGLTTTSMEQETDQYKYLYFYVGNFTQTALENTAGLNAELFNGKADLDLSNIAASAMSMLFTAMSPDYSQGTTLSQNTDYTATEDCWLYVSVNSSAQAAGADVNKTLTIGGASFNIISWAYNKNMLFMPCPKGTAFRLTNNNTGQGSYEFKKYPCKGI